MAINYKSKKTWLLAAVSVLALLGLFLWWAIGTALPRESELAVSRHPEFQEAAPKTRISVASYNIAYGQGVKEIPTDWRDEAYTRKKLAEVGNVVKRLNADVLLLQEVDINSNRSHHINQAEYLVVQGKYPYSACAVVWEKNYVPFPFWPIEHHLGEVKTANCVLSKYPLSWHKRIIFDKPASNPFWYNWGYLDRGAHRLDLKIGDQTLTVVNLHLEAFEQEAREKQARFLGKWIKDIKGPIVVGGDFNSIPREASKKAGFIDEPQTSFATDQTIEHVKKGLKEFNEALQASPCQTNEAQCHTFPADAPTRRLDYIFTSHGAQINGGRVFQEAGDASDHLPVVVELDLIGGSNLLLNSTG